MTTRTRTTKTRRNRTPKKPPTVDLRHPLPTRPKATGHSGITPAHLTEGHAALAAAHAGLLGTIPVLAWTATTGGCATYHAPTGGHLTYNPDTHPAITATTPCARGAAHTDPISSLNDLRAASARAQHCREDHVDGLQWPDMVRTTTIHALGQLDDDENDDGPDGEPADTTTHRPSWAATDEDENDLERTQPIDLQAWQAEYTAALVAAELHQKQQAQAEQDPDR